MFILDADDPVIGLVAFVPVGMSEVSSCVIDPTVTAGRHVDKGDDLGHFQFEGSTHCLVFQPGAIDSFALPATPQTLTERASPAGSGPQRDCPRRYPPLSYNR